MKKHIDFSESIRKSILNSDRFCSDWESVNNILGEFGAQLEEQLTSTTKVKVVCNVNTGQELSSLKALTSTHCSYKSYESVLSASVHQLGIDTPLIVCQPDDLSYFPMMVNIGREYLICDDVGEFKECIESAIPIKLNEIMLAIKNGQYSEELSVESDE